MFEFGRDLKRLFGVDADSKGAWREGLTGGDTSLLELLDLRLLNNEARSADVLAGRIDPGRVFDFETDLDGIAEAYAAMDERRAIKSLVRVASI